MLITQHRNNAKYVKRCLLTQVTKKNNFNFQDIQRRCDRVLRMKLEQQIYRKNVIQKLLLVLLLLVARFNTIRHKILLFIVTC